MIKVFLLRLIPEANYRRDKKQKTLNIISDSFHYILVFALCSLDEINLPIKASVTLI
jgi:hypothetical protein